MEKLQEMFTKDIKKTAKEYTKINSTLEGINSRLIDAEKQISDLEGTMMEITAIEQNIEKRVKKNK